MKWLCEIVGDMDEGRYRGVAFSFIDDNFLLYPFFPNMMARVLQVLSSSSTTRIPFFSCISRILSDVVPIGLAIISSIPIVLSFLLGPFVLIHFLIHPIQQFTKGTGTFWIVASYAHR